MTRVDLNKKDVTEGWRLVNSGFSAARVNEVLRELDGGSQRERRNKWLAAVAARVHAHRPDLQDAFRHVLGISPSQRDTLAGLTVGEVGVCYEALVSEMNGPERRSAGQYFTPDDAAAFMAGQTAKFLPGTWVDPCCGVGNLAWHLTNLQSDPSGFLEKNLVLVDRDDTALRTAVVLIAADFADKNAIKAVLGLHRNSVCRDFLSGAPLPDYDYAILNPPYARSSPLEEFKTGKSRELFAFFLERISATTKGFIAVTPASYLSAPKFQSLRTLLFTRWGGGDIIVFDNVPDTLFRGFKFGSTNSSKTNFVRAAITICSPALQPWMITPILRWKSTSRNRMFSQAGSFLSPMKIGPDGEWAKIPHELESTWEYLRNSPVRLKDLVVNHETPFHLTVALTPRYYISASFRNLERGSKTVLFFNSESERDRAAIVLNSSAAYFWWRALDGGVTLPKRVLYSTPVPAEFDVDDNLIEHLISEEPHALVTKLNAGKINENIKRPKITVDKLDAVVFGGENPDFTKVFSEDMFRLN